MSTENLLQNVHQLFQSTVNIFDQSFVINNKPELKRNVNEKQKSI